MTEPQPLSDDLLIEEGANFSFDAKHKVKVGVYETWEDCIEGKELNPVEEEK